MPGFSPLDWLHGYVYIRWPYLYIGIGTGEHWLARFMGPPVRLVGRLFPAPPRHDRETGTFADGYHGKVVPLEAAAQLVTVKEDVTLSELEQTIPYHAGARYCAAESGPHCRPGVPLPRSSGQSLPASRRLPGHRRAICQLCRRAPPPPLAMDQPGGGGGDPARRARARARPPRLLQGCHVGPLLCHLQLLFLLLWGHARPPATARQCWPPPATWPEVDEACAPAAGRASSIASSRRSRRRTDTLLVSASACMGCGVCVSKCPQEAISLLRDASSGEPLEIRELIARAAAAAPEV